MTALLAAYWYWPLLTVAGTIAARLLMKHGDHRTSAEGFRHTFLPATADLEPIEEALNTTLLNLRKGRA